MGGQTLSTHNISEAAEFSKIIPGYSWHTGFYLAIVILLIYWFVMKYTSVGYEVKTHGYNPRFLKYTGDLRQSRLLYLWEFQELLPA